jgi:hypothetical protein
MNLDTLLARLKDHKISVVEERKFPDEGMITYTLRCPAPEIPFGGHKELWATLTIDIGQTEVDRKEIEALLRHLWYGSLSFFGDEDDPDDDEEGIPAVTEPS